ncbi:NAD(P)-binding protein [Alternaria alternata]|nr:NAD(P)-binding protein [Alternaria alternata]
MAKKLILITGVSGHVGFRVLVEALARNYRVRAVVRRASQGSTILATSSVSSFASDVEIVVIEDLAKEGVFDSALEGVCGVLHVASPLAINVRWLPACR